jgi:hypothetical protein
MAAWFDILIVARRMRAFPPIAVFANNGLYRVDAATYPTALTYRTVWAKML